MPLGDEELQEILADATPPDVWSEEFIEALADNRTEDCDLSLRLPTVTFGDPVLGDVQGLQAAEDAIQQLDNFVLDIINILRSRLPNWINQQLNDVLGPYTPPPPPPPRPFPSIPMPPLFPNPFDPNGLEFQILGKVGEVAGRIAMIPTQFGVQQTVTPNPRFAPNSGDIGIRVGNDMEAWLRIYSRMESTFTFGQKSGTSYGAQNPTISQPQTMPLDHLPWFSKGFILKSVMPSQECVPYPMPLSHGYWIAQLGVAGARTALHSGPLNLTTGEGLDVTVVYNGNYGRVRVVVVPKKPCKIVWGDFEIKGPYEEDIAALEGNRYSIVEKRRDAIVKSLTDLQSSLGLIGTGAGAVPVFGALIDTLLGRLALLIEDKKSALVTGINSANNQQRNLNLALAETYPEQRPRGGEEDTDLP